MGKIFYGRDIFNSKDDDDLFNFIKNFYIPCCLEECTHTIVNIIGVDLQTGKFDNEGKHYALICVFCGKIVKIGKRGKKD